nr:hypothetical protein [Tanacetum cinerariifolium]
DPYKPTTILVQAVAATDDSPSIPEHTTVETPMNISPLRKCGKLSKGYNKVNPLIFKMSRQIILGTRDPYKPTTILVQAVAATDDSPSIPEHTTVETPMNISPVNKDHFEAEKEAIRLILTGIGDDIYSTVDA